MQAIRWLAFAAGIVVVLATWVSLIHTLVIPRGLRSKLAMSVNLTLRAVFVFLARRTDSYSRKDAILAHQGPISLLFLLLMWLAMLMLGFALILLRTSPGASLVEALNESGSAMLTLGFDAPTATASTYVHFLAAASGLVVIALQIAYLPVLYQAFNKRETLVTTLESRAGAPAWGPEILARHQSVGIMDSLPEFYSEWERWAAEVAESHTTYPVLISFRSPDELRHWVVGMLAVLDSAALYLASRPSTAPSEARLCLRMGFLTLRGIAKVIGIPFNPDPMPTDPIELTYEEFMQGVERMQAEGFAMERTPEDVWTHFKGWRVNYESLAYALMNRLLAVPGPWTGSRTHAPGAYISPVTPKDRRPDDPEARESGPKVWRT